MKKLSDYKWMDNRFNIAQAVYSVTDLDKDMLVVEIATKLRQSWARPIMCINTSRGYGKSALAWKIAKYMEQMQ
jgi:hypothetical protein